MEERAVGARDRRRTTRVVWNSIAPVALPRFRGRSSGWWRTCDQRDRGWRGERRRCVTSSPCGLELHGRLFEGVGDRVLEAQRVAFARGGIPCVGPAPCAGGLEECPLEPGLDRILGFVVAVCVGGADECRGALVVAVHDGDGSQATEAFIRLGPDDRFA